MKKATSPTSEGRHRYKVFVSSMFLDNQERRKLVQDAITMAGMVWHGIFCGGIGKNLKPSTSVGDLGDSYGESKCRENAASRPDLSSTEFF